MIPRAEDTEFEERVAMKLERAERYPSIEQIEAKGYSASPDDPIEERLWADPVNLMYPVAYAGDDSPDPDRAANARARFKQFGARTYERNSSLSTVHERIVRAEIASGITPSYDPNDALDSLLPDELIARITKRSQQMSNYKETLRRLATEKSDRLPTIKSVVEDINRLKADLGDKTAVIRLTKMAYDLTSIAKNFEGDWMAPPVNMSGPQNFGAPLAGQVAPGEPVAVPQSNMVDERAVPVPVVDESPVDATALHPAPTANYMSGPMPGSRVPQPQFIGVPMPIMDIPAGGAEFAPAGIGKGQGR